MNGVRSGDVRLRRRFRSTGSRFSLLWLGTAFWLCSAAAWASESATPQGGAEDLPTARELESAFAGEVWKLGPDASRTRSLKRRREQPWDLRSVASLSLKARVRRSPRIAVRLRWIVESRSGGVYAATIAPVAPHAGDPSTLVVRLDAGDLAPIGHGRPWDALAAAEVVSLELRAEEDFDRPVEVELREPLLIVRDKAVDVPETRVLDVRLEPAPPGIAAAATLAFRLEPCPADPYAFEGSGDVRAAGADFEALAFFDQRFSAVPDGSAWRLAPVGAPYFRAYLPRLPANGALTIRSGDRAWNVPAAGLAWHSAPPPAERALESRWDVPLTAPLRSMLDPTAERLWAGAPEAWRFSPGDPEGWTIAPPPEAAEGWRPVPFWNAAWGRFGGALRPDFELALRMDARLADAAKRGERKPLILLDGEFFARQGVFNWQAHPLNRACGGPLAGPGALFDTPDGQSFCLRAARYALARWGRARAVDGCLVSVRLNATAAPLLHARLAAAARTWPPLAHHELALHALHPLARAPQTISQVPLNDPVAEAMGGRWRAEAGSSTRVEPEAAANGEALRAVAPGREGSVSVLKPLLFPAAAWDGPAPDHFHAADALLFEVALPPDAPADLRAGVHLRDRDELWYQTLLPGLLRPGDTSTCVLDLTERNAQELRGIEHAKPWTGYSRGRIREIGIHVYTTHTDKPVDVRILAVRAVRFDRAEIARPPALTLRDAPQKELRIGEVWTVKLNLDKSYANPFDPREADLQAFIATPSGQTVAVPAFFDQDCRRSEDKATGHERVEPVGDEHWTVRYRALEPGVHGVRFELREGGAWLVSSQDWARDWRFTNDGRPYRAMPRNPDDWHYEYENRDGGGRRRVERLKWKPGEVAAVLDLGNAAFTVRGKSEGWRGFVRTDADRRHFRFDDGSFYYALGPCLRSPSDNRLPYKDPKWEGQIIPRIEGRGTYQYDEYLAKFQDAGITWTRIWMCSWWGALQWRRDWPGYQGLGKYNLLNAWRMDHVLDACERAGVRVSLCLNNHGQFSHAIDTEWAHNPYSTRFGGPLESPAEFFSKADAKIFHLNYLRYVAARWGHSSAVLAWDLFSELEFTDEYRISLGMVHEGQPDRPAPQMESWHSGMARYLKSVDPNKHLVATHFSHPVRGYGVLGLPEIDVAASNAYSAFDELAEGKNDASAALAEFWAGNQWGGGVFRGGMKQHNKPVLVEEQGRHWLGVKWEKGRLVEHNSRTQLDADLHTGLWGSLVQPLAGATGYWWWLHLHFDDRYGEYRALAEYLKGEDLRAAAGESPLEPELLPIQSHNQPLLARALRSDRRAYVWIYHPLVPHRTEGIPLARGATLLVPSLRRGKYRVEFWSTREGRLEATTVAELPAAAPRGPAAMLNVPLPVIAGDVAVKIKLLDGER